MKRARDAEALREVIKARGLSYRQLGRITECSYNTFYLLLRGEMTADDRAARISRALGYPVVDELFMDAMSTVKQPTGKKEAAR